MSKKVAITQSNYIPWKGYFDMINIVDEFILYDDMQYTRRDWRNRNKIKTSNGIKWITIPVQVKGKYYQKIKDTKISDPSWPQKHWKIISHNYAKSTYFKDYKDHFEELYNGVKEGYLSKINYYFIKAICDMLDIRTKISWSMDYRIIGDKTLQLVDICLQAGASELVSGPRAKAYLDESILKQHGLCLTYMDYSGYPEYRQLYPPFEHAVSIIDLILNEGPHATRFMKSF